MAPAERGQALHRLADLIEAEAAELGRLDSTDMGKPIRQAIGLAANGGTQP